MADDTYKSEKATPFKLKEAKEKGQVSKSIEITSLLMLVGFFATLLVVGASVWAGLADTMKQLLLSSGQIKLTPQSVPEIGIDLAITVAALFAPLITVVIFGALLFNMIQTGPIFSTHPIKPDWKRLNPVEGFKKIISIKTAFDFFKALLKVGSIYLAWVVFGEYWLREILASYGMSAHNFLSHWVEMASSVLLLLFALLLPLAVLDFAFARWDFSKKMMMSTQDVKDEHKKREGDPHVKQKQKQIQKELLKKASSLKSVKDADVIITNPEHIAIALKYVPKTMLAPKILAMGEDNNAATIRKIARSHNVPIVRNVPLARRIYKSSVIDGFIPESSYDDVARIFKAIFKTRAQMQSRSDQ